MNTQLVTENSTLEDLIVLHKSGFSTEVNDGNKFKTVISNTLLRQYGRLDGADLSNYRKEK
jgi:hypothetical protein